MLFESLNCARSAFFLKDRRDQALNVASSHFVVTGFKCTEEEGVGIYSERWGKGG